MEALWKRWKTAPPLSVTARIIAARLGAEFKAEDKEPENDLQGLIDMLGGAGMKSEKPEWLTT
jgi:hypothetical protein